MKGYFSFFHSFQFPIHIYVNNQLSIPNLKPLYLSKNISMPQQFYPIKITHAKTSEIIYYGNFPCLIEEETIIFPIDEKNCFVVLKNGVIPPDESIIRIINTSTQYPSIDLIVTKGDPLFTNIKTTEVSNWLPIVPMVIQLEIHSNSKKQKSIQCHIKKNHQYSIIVYGNKLDYFILEHTNLN